MSNSVRSHRWQPTRLPRPWDSPGKNTGMGCHFLLQCMKVKSESEVAQSCPTPSNPMDCSPPGSSVHGVAQSRTRLSDFTFTFHFHALEEDLLFGILAHHIRAPHSLWDFSPHWPGVPPPSSHRSPWWVWFPDVHVSPQCVCVVLCVTASRMHNPDLLIPRLHARGPSMSQSPGSQSSYQTQVAAEETTGSTRGMRGAG